MGTSDDDKGEQSECVQIKKTDSQSDDTLKEITKDIPGGEYWKNAEVEENDTKCLRVKKIIWNKYSFEPSFFESVSNPTKYDECKGNTSASDVEICCYMDSDYDQKECIDITAEDNIDMARCSKKTWRRNLLGWLYKKIY